MNLSRRIFVIFTLLLAVNSGYGQNNHLTPKEIDGKWGYVDDSDKVVIPPRFDAAGFFS